MAFRLLFSSLCALLLVGSSAGVSHAKSWHHRHPAPDPPAAAEVPTSWMGEGTGNDLLWLSGRGWSHRGSFHHVDVLEQDVRVEEGAVHLMSLDGEQDWAGTLDAEPARHGHHHGRHHRHRPSWAGMQSMRVDFASETLDAIAEHLAMRLAEANDGRFHPAGDVHVSISSYKVEIEVRPDDGTFFVSGGVSFQAGAASRRHGRHGLYLFRLAGDMQELAPEPEPEPEPAGPIRVLLLGDNRSQTQVETALLDAGYEVTTIARYADWDGVTPAVADFDVVVYLDGYQYGVGLMPDADAALAAFVAGGGGLVRTEWSVWAGLVNPMTDPLLPLTYAGGFRYATNWNVVLPDHPLVAGVAPTWFDGGDYSLGNPVPGATVAIETADGWPLLTARTDTGGPVVHINNAMTYRVSVLDPNLLQVFVNSVAFAAGR